MLVADILQNISVQNVNKAFVYITDWTSPLKFSHCVLILIVLYMRQQHASKVFLFGPLHNASSFRDSVLTSFGERHDKYY